MKHIFNKKLFVVMLLLSVVVLLLPIIVLAQANNMLWGGQAGNFQSATGLGSTDPRILAANIIRIALGFLGIIALILIIYGGWLWMTSGGDPSKVEKAKKLLLAAIIGLIIIVMSFALVTFILNQLYIATGGGGPTLPTCDAGSVGTCSGCQRCTGGPPYAWVLDSTCPGCSTGPGPGPLSCDGNTMLAGCQADVTICDAAYGLGTHTCDPGTCTCQPLGGVGDPCDSVPATASCEADDTLCMSDLTCNSTICVCEGAPVIDWVSPVDSASNPNGAVGNFVTIGGRFFGTTTGAVYFSDSTGFNALAPFPDTVNPACTAYWSDNQIIVIVPGAAITGPIRVIRTDNQRDDTNNTRGPNLPNFQVNSIVRPGLCQLNPSQGILSDIITYQGINLTNTKINFGDYANFVPAQNPTFPGSLQGTAGVPNISFGLTTTYASSTAAYGNFLYFRVNQASSTGPYIISFAPTTGAPGQYVTIYGSGFGYSRGTSKVFFGDEVTGTEANYTFPQVCQDSFWQDKQVVVKVPNGAPNGAHVITMVIGANVINTSALSPSTFNVNSALPLTPGLCRIQPVMGPNNSKITLWGEYFDAFTVNISRVRFHLNHDQFGPLAPTGPIISWGPDGNADKVEAIVHPQAVTGPVQVVKAGPLVSNGLNFTVGSCQRDADCGGTDVCCPTGTFAAGRCVININQCYLAIPNSVFEWDFSTLVSPLGIPCDGDLVTPLCQASSTICTLPLACDPMSCICLPSTVTSCTGYGLGNCLSGFFCPNSPGQCSPYAGGNPQVVGNCDNTCTNVGSCTTNCTYNSGLDRCVLIGATCNLSHTEILPRIGSTTATCELYQGLGRWHIMTSQSCPNGWQRITGNRCVDLSRSCSACQSGFNCLNSLCAASPDICPDNATCNGSDQCVAIDQPVCECCCEIGQDARDCCTPLRCQGTCGSSASFGHCTGCANAGTTQADHDVACNCLGHSGKYCDMSVAGGVCRDCTVLDSAQCQLHSTSCCIDAKSSNACRGGPGDLVATDPGYCAYYNCQPPPFATLCDSNPIILGNYKDLPSCTSGCGSSSPSGLGLSCALAATSTCDISICANPFSCLNSDGSGASYPNCGFCCCDPTAAVDVCTTINPSNPNLHCQADQAPCSGSGRGLCCGCQQDADCGNNSLGCGQDGCCRTRPSVTAVYPADDSTNICRNTIMRATFDQLMDASSFSGNLVVLADYQGATCPAGTEFLALNNYQPPGQDIFHRYWHKIVRLISQVALKVLPGQTARAYTAPSSSNIYCAITGSVSSYQTTTQQTVVEFKPSKLLDGDRLYYVVILGDKNLDSKQGVLNFWRIGMNGPHNETFNGLNYFHSYIWSFRTFPEQAANNGVCKLDHVDIQPSSYLFPTITNDVSDDNPADSLTFDTKTDSDKVFIALPKSIDNQILNPIPPDYTWTWNWLSNNPNVADIVTGVLGNDQRLIRTGTNITEGRTTIIATAQVIDNIFIPPTGNVSGYANVYVFICANPWPPITSTGSWAPWRDQASNCTPALIGSGCVNTNYELYYCRDQGEFGTYDDLPAIISNQTIIRGSNIVTNILKEAFYLREVAPTAASSLSLTAVATGGSVDASWSVVAGAAGYKLYWGTTSGHYTDFVDAGSVTTYTVNNLTNGTTYYFNLTSYSSGGAETQPYGEVTIVPRDTVGPGMPTGLSAATTTTGVELSWNSVTGAVSYEVSYGITAGVYGQSVNVGQGTKVVIRGLTKGNTYYFAVVALDASDNPSSAATLTYTYL